MAKSRKGIFARNISSNLAGYLVGAVVALFLSPYVIRTMGKVQFGMWAFLVSLTGYYGLLDLGVRSAVGQYVTRYWSNKDVDGVNRTFSTSMVLLLIVAGIGVAVTSVLVYVLPGFLEAKNVSAKESGQPFLSATELQKLIHDGRVALGIAGVGIAAGIPMALWSTATYARERFDIANAIGIGERLLLAGLTVLALHNGFGIVGLATVTVGSQLLASVIRMVVAYRLMPGLHVQLRWYCRESRRELLSYGIYNFMVNAADRIVLYMDATIIGSYLLLADVTDYDIGSKLIPYYMSLILAITWTMTPYATSCDARGDTGALRRLLLQGTRGTMYLAAVICAGLLMAGDGFLHVWMGDELLAGNTSYQVLAILSVATLARASTSCGRQILFGMRKMRLLAGMAGLEAALNITLSLFLVRSYGLPGVAMGTLISIVIVYVIGQNYYVVKFTEASGWSYLWQMSRATIPVMGCMFLVDLWCQDWLFVDSWSWFGVKVALLAVPVLPIGYFLVMNHDEREMIRRRLRRRRRPSDDAASA